MLDLPGGRLARTDKPAKVADRLHRLAALARRAEILLLILDAPGLAGGLATAVAESTGLRLELARRSWIRLGRDIVGQRTEALVARNRYGPPGRRATLRILYAEGGERDACLRRDDLLIDAPIPTADQAPAIRISNGPTAMRLLHLYRPHLPLGLATARASEPFPPGPLVLGGRPWDPGTVIDANPDARALGVRRGIPLASAHRLAPEAPFVDPDPEADRAAAEAAFEALAAVQPGPRRDDRPGRRGVRPVRGPGSTASSRCGAPSRSSSSASTAALAATLPGECRDLVPCRDRRARASPRPSPRSMPVPAGRSSSRPVTRRRSSPRTRPACSPGPRRPGPAQPLRAAPDRGGGGARPVRARRPLRGGGRASPCPGAGRGDRSVPAAPDPGTPDPALAHRAAVGGARVAAVRPAPAGRRAHRAAVGAGPGRRPRAHLRLELDLAFARAGTAAEVAVEQRFPEPTADAEAIERLLFARLERDPPPAAVARLDLELAGVGPAAGQQLPLFVPQAARDARLGWQLARLALTFGEDRIRRVALLDPEAPLPEARWTWRSVGLGEPGTESGG